jgi:8-oxo-dGTP pyrophosphatase MutT (NUDIX family)
MLRGDMQWPGRRMGAAAAIFDAAGSILLVHHTYGPLNWELPGGASEAGESIVETALRELREETGLEAEAESLTGIYYDGEHDAHHYVFRCRADDAASPTPRGEEIDDCGYWPLAKLPRPISDFTVRRIEDAQHPALQPLPVAIPPRAWLE